jgi:hypothetical protein
MTNIKPGDNLQAVINSAGVGATISAAPGTYSVNARVNLLSGQTLAGVGAVFKGADNDVFGVHGTMDVTIDGVTIDGGWCGVIGNSATRLKIRNCTLKNQGGGLGCGVWLLAPVDCEVVHNKFNNVGFGGSEARGVFTQDSRGTKVDHNDFTDCVSAVHAYWFGDAKTPHKSTFNFNKCRGKFAWHCLEIQYAANTIEIVGNDIRDLGPAAFGMGISCATGGDPNKKRPNGSVMGPFDTPPNTSYNVLVADNVIDMSGKGNTAANSSQYAGIEIMGDTCTIRNNFIKNAGQAILYGLNTGNLTVIDNTIVGCPTTFAGEYEHHEPFIQANNAILPTASTPAPPVDPNDGGGSSPVITNVKATEANPPVVTWTGGATRVTRTDQHGQIDKKPDGSLAVFPSAVSPFTDNFIPVDHFENTWHVQYVVGDAAPVQIQLPKPTTPPPGSGFVVTNETEIDEKGKVLSSKSTTKPRTVAP